MTYSSLESLVVEVAQTVRPPERLTVSEAAAKHRLLNNPGSYVGPWLNEKTPYLVEPQDVLTSQEYTGMVFAGPAQCGKTDMFLNYLTYSIMCDPADLILIQTSMLTARDFSMRRIDRFHRHNPHIQAMMIQRKDADNTNDKHYQSGMLLTLAHPSIKEVSGKPIPRGWITDYDRIEPDIDGEGNLFDLLRKRMTTFGRYGMTVAESSPGFVCTEENWRPSTPHQPPPTEGILALYGRGDRRRWYWRCVHCQNPFEPDFSLLRYPESADLMESAEMATMECPHCRMHYSHENSGPSKAEMNLTARWLKEGQTWLPDGRMEGTARRTDLATFWLKGVCAAFTDWKSLVLKFRQAEREYEETGSETALKSTVNTDQGVPYVPKKHAQTRDKTVYEDRAQMWTPGTVPDGVRFLLACVDVQKNRFVVQVHGFGVNGDLWVVDRYEVRKSDRKDEDGDTQALKPGSHPEDWHKLVDAVILKTYPLGDGSDRAMAIKLVVCDSGGREGVTANAYAFVRWLRAQPKAGETKTYWKPDLAWRFLLLKGDARPNQPRIQITNPDSERRDRQANARGEIPVILANSNALKDQLDGMLNREDGTGRRVYLPKFAEPSFFEELIVETRDPKKGWQNLQKKRNETWDLLYYALAGSLVKFIGIETMDWTKPPSWADEWDYNSLVSPIENGTTGAATVVQPASKPTLKQLAERLAS